MGYITKLYVAPRTELRRIADTPSASFPSSGSNLEQLDSLALIRLQALIDGITDWDDDTVAIEFESSDYVESQADDGGWSCVVPNRFTRSFAALPDAEIERLVPVWGQPDVHAGRRFPLSEAAGMIRAIRELAVRATAENLALIFSTRE